MQKSIFFTLMLLCCTFAVASSSYAAPLYLPKTGQATVYYNGDDGSLQKGVASPNPRFTNVDGTTPITGGIVVDQLTGLMWTTDGNAPRPTTWQGALDYIASLNANSFLGFSDWRLPNRNELRSLINYGQANNASWLNTQGFTNVQADYYWSSTTPAFLPTSSAWSINLLNGLIGTNNKGYSKYVWPVRSGQSQLVDTSLVPIKLSKTGQTTAYYIGDDGSLQKGIASPNPRFTNIDGTTPVTGGMVVDQLTGLMWTTDANAPGPACSPGTTKTWQDALNYVACLNTSSYLGYGDWRLPNRNELRSLVNYGQANNASWLNTQGSFINVQADYYWSSTTAAFLPTSARSVNLLNGLVGTNNKGYSEYVWPVRGGSFTVRSHVVTPTAGANGSISPAAPQIVNFNQTASFTLTPAAGYHIASATGCSGSLNGNIYTTGPVTDDCTVSATFAITTYTVTPAAGTNGTIFPSTPQTITYNQTASVTVTPSTGYHIDMVTGCGGSLNANTYVTGPIISDCTISATFAINTFTVTPAVDANGSISPTTPQIVNYNSPTSFTITPTTGYHIASVTGCGGSLNGSTYTTGPITADCTVSAAFASDTHILTVSKAGTGSGTVTSSPAGISCGATCSAVYNYGTSVTLTATPNSDSFFAGWSGACSGSTCAPTMIADQSASATFTQYITVTAPNGGEAWTRNSTYTIRWNYAGNPGSNVKIELLKSGSLNRTIANSTSIGSGGSGSYSWKVPGSQTTGTDFTIRITSTSNSNYKDVSNANFSIQ